MLKKKGKRICCSEIDVLLLLLFFRSYIAPDDDQEQETVDLTQSDIQSSVDVFSAQKRFDLQLPLYGPYHIDYTRNGR